MKQPTFFLATCMCLLFLSGCNPDGAIKPTQPEKIEERSEIRKIRTAKAGRIIYQEKSLNTHPALQLHEGINVKHSSFYAPRLRLRKGEYLVQGFENKKYAYYAVQKDIENVRELLLEIISADQKKQINSNYQGIRRDKKTGALDGFVISSDREYSYDLPKNMTWANTTVYPKSTKNSLSTIRFLGIQNNKLVFSHYDFFHKPKRFGKDNHHEINKYITAPKDAKRVTIDQHVIQIIKATPFTLQYKILS